METDPIRVCELIVGLPDVNVLGVEDLGAGRPLRLHIECRGPRPACEECGSPADVKDRPQVELVDLPAFGRPVRTVWRKHRWRCPDFECPTSSWTGVDTRIAAPRLGLTDRAGRWATIQVGKCGRTVSEVARELDCDWHTVNNAVLAYGEALLEADTDRVGQVTALGMDETLFARVGVWRRPNRCTHPQRRTRWEATAGPVDRGGPPPPERPQRCRLAAGVRRVPDGRTSKPCTA